MTEIQTPVSHAQAAEELVQKIRALHSTVPGFELVPTPLDRYQRPRGHRTLPDDFFLPLEAALTRSDRFAGSVAITPFDIRDMLEYCAAYLPAAVEMERFARGIRYGAAVKRGNVGKLAMEAYRLAKSMNLALGLGLIIPEVEDMRATFKTGRRAGSTAPGSPATPAPEAPVVSIIRSSR